ncbi:MAG: (Fe-S)-binding protein, partial [Flavobacteriales bacterium]|nr:(Fe-S)-binding protein [Flavobacteriales bacterium]
MEPIKVPTMAEFAASGEVPEVLFWVGCAGSFDDRARKITKSFVRILGAAKVKFAVLGQEESCTGDPARRAGNEFLFQMQALQNVSVLNGYGVKRIVTACPHCFNTLKNEYPALGGAYEVLHHTQFINALIKEGRIKVEGGSFKGKRITFHD